MDLITGLKLVRTTLDSVEVVGIANMDKLVGCDNMLKTCIDVLEDMEKNKPAPQESEDVNG